MQVIPAAAAAAAKLQQWQQLAVGQDATTGNLALRLTSPALAAAEVEIYQAAVLLISNYPC
jgi:hypothetical protein